MSRRTRSLVGLLAVAGAVVAGSALCAVPAGAKENQPSVSITSSQSFFFCCTRPNTHQVIVKNVGGGATGTLAATLSFTTGNSFAITDDRCTGRSLGPGKECVIALTWLVGTDTVGALSVGGPRAQGSAEFYGTIVP